MASPSPKTGILYNDPKISSSPIDIVKIHPLVIYSIADSYQRRGDADYAIGILLGEASVVDRQAIVYDVVPCKLDPKTVVDQDLKKALYAEHRSIYPREDIIGYYIFSQRQVDWYDVIQDNSCGIRIWLRPTIPPKIDCYTLYKVIVNDSPKLIAQPIEYVIEASLSEQAALSRLAATSSKGSLQAAINELLDLLKVFEKICLQTTGIHARDSLIGRQIYVALANTQLKEADKLTLEKAQADIRNFLEILQNGDNIALEAEKQLSLPLK
ncbi:Eukaryotic translation initiation factor 3 subunit F [Tritrichomonas musculus]|uniref:Eukaryotic translation initiation factor 3 subunit F n=1 Tax=Tritrichomonas musculus TaxID=1915356 RepID=A0ABR2HIX2_9EUKA